MAQGHLGATQGKLSCLTQRGYFKGKKGNILIKKERKRKRQKEKEIEKKGMAIWSDVAEELLARSRDPILVCCVSLDKSAALSGPHFSHLQNGLGWVFPEVPSS